MKNITIDDLIEGIVAIGGVTCIALYVESTAVNLKKRFPRTGKYYVGLMADKDGISNKQVKRFIRFLHSDGDYVQRSEDGLPESVLQIRERFRKEEISYRQILNMPEVVQYLRSVNHT